MKIGKETVFTKSSCLLLMRIIAPDLCEDGRQLTEIQIPQRSHSEGPLLVCQSLLMSSKADIWMVADGNKASFSGLIQLLCQSLDCSQSTANALKPWILG